MKMLEDLAEVVRLPDFDAGDITACIVSHKFLLTHHATTQDLAKRLEECEQECLEQARLLGMGSEREAALMAKLEAAERDAAVLTDAQCDAIYAALSEYGSDVDHYEFGLPWHCDAGPEERRKVIRKAAMQETGR